MISALYALPPVAVHVIIVCLSPAIILSVFVTMSFVWMHGLTTAAISGMGSILAILLFVVMCVALGYQGRDLPLQLIDHGMFVSTEVTSMVGSLVVLSLPISLISFRPLSNLAFLRYRLFLFGFAIVATVVALIAVAANASSDIAMNLVLMVEANIPESDFRNPAFSAMPSLRTALISSGILVILALAYVTFAAVIYCYRRNRSDVESVNIIRTAWIGASSIVLFGLVLGPTDFPLFEFAANGLIALVVEPTIFGYDKGVFVAISAVTLGALVIVIRKVRSRVFRDPWENRKVYKALSAILTIAALVWMPSSLMFIEAASGAAVAGYSAAGAGAVMVCLRLFLLSVRQMLVLHLTVGAIRRPWALALVGFGLAIMISSLIGDLAATHVAWVASTIADAQADQVAIGRLRKFLTDPESGRYLPVDPLNAVWLIALGGFSISTLIHIPYARDKQSYSTLLSLGLGLTAYLAFSTMSSIQGASASGVLEIRRQFREYPGIMLGMSSSFPDAFVNAVFRVLAEQLWPVLVLMLMITFLTCSRRLGAWTRPVVVVALVSGLFLFAGGYLFDLVSNGSRIYIEAGNHGGRGSYADKAARVVNEFSQLLFAVGSLTVLCTIFPALVFMLNIGSARADEDHGKREHHMVQRDMGGA